MCNVFVCRRSTSYVISYQFACTARAHPFILSKLDFGNCLLAGITVWLGLIDQLQDLTSNWVNWYQCCSQGRRQGLNPQGQGLEPSRPRTRTQICILEAKACPRELRTDSYTNVCTPMLLLASWRSLS